MIPASKKGYRRCICVIVLAVIPVLSADSTASENPPVDSTHNQSVRDLDRMVITATRTPKKQENVPAIVTVIHTDEIEHPYMDIDQLGKPSGDRHRGRILST